MFAEEVVRGGRDGGEMGREGMSKYVCVVSVLLCNECCIIVDLEAGGESFDPTMW